MAGPPCSIGQLIAQHPDGADIAELVDSAEPVNAVAAHLSEHVERRVSWWMVGYHRRKQCRCG